MLSCSCTCLMTSDGRWHKNIELDRSTGSKMKQRWSRKPNSKLIFFYIQHWPRKHFDEWMHDRNMQFPSGSLFLRKLIFVVKLEFQQMQKLKVNLVILESCNCECEDLRCVPLRVACTWFWWLPLSWCWPGSSIRSIHFPQILLHPISAMVNYLADV